MTPDDVTEALRDVVNVCELENLRARLAPPATPSCVGCGCIRFLPSGRCALCGGHA